MTSDQRELLEELRRLCERLPVPDGAWHPYAAAIAEARRDFQAALEFCAREPGALDLVAGAPSAARSAALDRLDALPTPEGRHPFLDEILPALDAARATLAAVAAFRAEHATVAA